MYGRDHEYANKLGKQVGKNPRKIPKFSIDHERFSRTIEKISKITPMHSSYGISTIGSNCPGISGTVPGIFILTLVPEGIAETHGRRTTKQSGAKNVWD